MSPSDITCVELVAAAVSFLLFIVLVVVPLFDIRRLVGAILRELRNGAPPDAVKMIKGSLFSEISPKARTLILLLILLGIVVAWLVGGHRV